ncbi:MAG: hypothetical protein LBS29_02265, partial [Endomicrobium sp.]|jgi:hypothetical protein|nr:hypothetical protein [Endomicrobium sp.]
MNNKRVIRRDIKVRRKPRGRSIYSSTLRIRRVSNSTIARNVIIRTISDINNLSKRRVAS